MVGTVVKLTYKLEQSININRRPELYHGIFFIQSKNIILHLRKKYVKMLINAKDLLKYLIKYGKRYKMNK